MSETAEHSMKIFISYGHPEAEICQRIMERLQRRGHDVWFDREQIHHGENWRRKIEEGIETSQGVISCLSKHSVRDPGVCLDELSIAVGVKGGNIFTVLLESERDVQPPASICHLQWVDMSDWQQRWGTPDFEPWFEARMAQIIERVESPESVRFAGEIDELKKRLTVDYSTGKQRSLLRQAFVGRKWLTAEVRAWLDDPNGAPICVLYGDPGVGKSAFAAWFSHRNQAVAASLFLEYDQPHYRDARSVIMTLAYLLACRIVDFRKALLTALDGLDLSRLNESALFDRLIAEPARRCIDGARETMCIVIDGLDESSGAERNALADVLSDNYVSRLPHWLRILVTSREVTEVMAPLEGAFQLTLHGAEARNKADVRAYFEEMLGEQFGDDPAWPNALDALTERSDGIFLYARLVVNGMQSGRMGIGDISQFPQGLSAAFHRWFNWFFPDYDEFKRKYRLPLGMILASPEPLPRDELMRTLDWGELEQADFIRRIQVLLLQDEDDFGQPTIRFSHQYLMEWLSADPATQPYAVSRRDSIAAMARAFYEYFEEDPEDLTHYEALHLTDYLRQAGKKSRARAAEMSRDLLWQIIDAGDHCGTWGKLDHALACFRQGQAMAEAMCAERDELEDRRSLSLCFDRAAKILNVQGKLEEALELFERARAIAEQLVRERGTPEDRSGLSTSCNNMAVILNALGKRDEALALYEKSIAIIEQLASERGSLDDRRGLSANYSNMAGILEAKGKPDEALALYEKALAIHEQLVRERGTPEDRKALGIGYDKIAGILKAKGELDEALALYEKARAIAEQLASERGTPGDRRELSINYSQMASIREAQRRPDEALALYEKARAIAEQLVRERGTPDDRRELAVGCSNVAQILKKQEKFGAALALYKRSLAITEQLASERDTPDNRRSLGFSCSNVAHILREQGELSEALALFEKSLAIAERLASERGTPGDRRDLCVGCCNVAKIKQGRGESDEALALYERALAIAEQLIRERDTPENRRSLGFGYVGMAEIRKAQGKRDEALKLYRNAIATFEQLVHACDAPDDRWSLSVVYDDAADIRAAQGKRDQALALYEKALAIRERLNREQGTPDNLLALGMNYGTMADIREAQGKLSDALKMFGNAIAVFERLVRECDAPENRRNLRVCYERTADIHKALGNMDKALEMYKKSLAMLEQLAQARSGSQDWDNLDDLAACLYSILLLPNVPPKSRLAYARRGLQTVQKLMERQPSDHYRIMMFFFQFAIGRG